GLFAAGRAGKQWQLATGRIEGIKTRCRAGHRRRLDDGETLEAPKEDPQIRNVLPSGFGAPTTKIGGMRVFVERGSHLRRTVDAAEVRIASDRGLAASADQPLGCQQRRIPSWIVRFCWDADFGIE